MCRPQLLSGRRMNIASRELRRLGQTCWRLELDDDGHEERRVRPGELRERKSGSAAQVIGGRTYARTGQDRPRAGHPASAGVGRSRPACHSRKKCGPTGLAGTADRQSGTSHRWARHWQQLSTGSARASRRCCPLAPAVPVVLLFVLDTHHAPSLLSLSPSLAAHRCSRRRAKTPR